MSIITVCFNAAETIEQTIQSVLGQTYQEIEYIIIDGKSTDGTLDILLKYQDKIAKIVSEEDAGIYDAMNKGIKLATGDLIGILNADDWYDAAAVEQVVECFLKNETDIVHGDIRLVWGDGRTEDAPKTGDREKLWYSMVIRHPATFVKRKVYEEQGLFDLNYKITADYEFILRCYSRKVKFTYLDKVLTNFRMTGISNTQGEQCAKETRRAALQYIGQAPDRESIYRLFEEQEKTEKFNHIFFEEPERVLRVLKGRLQKHSTGIIIWGTGVWGKRIKKLCSQAEIPILYFVDSNRAADGFAIEGIPVKPPQVLGQQEAFVLVAIKTIDDRLRKQIKETGLTEEAYLTLGELIEETLE